MVDFGSHQTFLVSFLAKNTSLFYVSKLIFLASFNNDSLYIISPPYAHPTTHSTKGQHNNTMSGPSRANVPKYNLSAMLQQVGSQGAGAARDGAWGQRTAPQQGYEEGVFSASKPLRALPQSAATVEAKRRQRSVEPARPAAAPSTPAELQVWVTVFGADWSRIGSVKATLSERFGAIVDCKIPTKESNAGHYKFDSSQAALMAVQVHSFTVAGTEVHTAPCTDEVRFPLYPPYPQTLMMQLLCSA